MGMNLEITEEDGTLTAEVTGRFALDDANRAMVELFRTVAEHSTKRVLVDCRPLEGRIRTMENFDHAVFATRQLAEHIERGVSPATRFAYVTAGQFTDPRRFAENVAVNRGMIVRTFDNIDEARAWLADPSGESED